jgi:hypothetical protein
MTELDQALETMRRDMSDAGNQSRFYDLFLNATFFVPTLDEQLLGGAGERAPDGEVLPLVIEAEGNDYLILFDSKERLHAWAEAEVGSVEVPGHVLAATTQPPLHWALNVGTEHAKQFCPEEIAWLREVVERCNVEASQGSDE